jgi:hypothetical protein
MIMIGSRFLLLAPDGKALAELSVACDAEGWYTGKVLSQDFPPSVKGALEWYNEVVQHQMLSYLDEATSAVESLDLRIKSPDESIHRVYSLHIAAPDEVSFRITPVPEPAVPQTGP